MIIDASPLVITETSLTTDHPIIGWRNVVTVENVTATNEDADYPATNLANPATHLYWQAGANSPPTSPQYLTVSTTGSGSIDYVGLAKHNLGTAESTVSVEGDTGGGFATIAGPFGLGANSPADDSPIVFRFAAAAYTQVRVKIVTPSVVPFVAVLYVGKLLVLPRKIWQGHTPITFGRRQKVINGKSESGNFLGRIITGEWRESKQTISLIDPDDYREDIDDFFEAGKDTPWFFGWRPVTYPHEVGYVWFTNDPMPRNSDQHGLTEFELQMTGIV
jgi:hypothetical protein